MGRGVDTDHNREGGLQKGGGGIQYYLVVLSF